MSDESRLVYIEFLAQVVRSGVVWSVRCEGDLIVLTGAHSGFFPLWPDLRSARFFSTRHWPSFEPIRMPLEMVLQEHLGVLARAKVHVGVGVAPHPEAIVLRAKDLRQHLLAAQRLA